MKHLLPYSLIFFLALSSCVAVKKKIYPSRYCAMSGCHLKHAEESDYCTFHESYVINEIVGKAVKLKMDNKRVEDKKSGNKDMDSKNKNKK